jgi:hypothetical protein
VIALTQIAVILKMEGRPRSLIVYRSSPDAASSYVVFQADEFRAGAHCETLPLRSQYTLMSQLSGHRSQKRYGIANRKKNRWQSAVR